MCRLHKYKMPTCRIRIRLPMCSQMHKQTHFFSGDVFCLCAWKEKYFFICHIHNYTEYNQQCNVFSAFNPSKCTHTWSSGHTHTHTPGAVETHTHTHLEQWTHTHTHTHTWSSGDTHTHTHTHTHTWSSGHTHTHTPGAVGSRHWGHWARGVVDNSCRSRDSNPQPRVTSPTLYQLGHCCPGK